MKSEGWVDAIDDFPSQLHPLYTHKTAWRWGRDEARRPFS